MIRSFDGIIAAAAQAPPRTVVCPDPGPGELAVLAEAARRGIARPWCIGGAAAPPGAPFRFDPEEDPRAAVRRALEAVKGGGADVLMEGRGPGEAFLEALGDPREGLGVKGSVMSHVSVYPLLKTERLILVTDTYINNRPDLARKQQILANALSLARRLGWVVPKVAVLAAIEQVNPGIPSTVDAAVLSKMGERGQFGRAVVEGPIDIDCALSATAAQRKGLKSAVTGDVDIYVVPDGDTGCLLAEALVFFGRMETIGCVLGGVAPAVLNLPYVEEKNRLAAVALACLAAGKGGGNG